MFTQSEAIALLLGLTLQQNELILRNPLSISPFCHAFALHSSKE